MKTLIAAQLNFDDKMIEIHFAGDIDGDGIIDFIIDTSRHYNQLSPTLYLSKPAKEKGSVIPIAIQNTVGC